MYLFLKVFFIRGSYSGEDIGGGGVSLFADIMSAIFIHFLKVD